MYRPQKLIIGGSVIGQNDILIKPLQHAVDEYSFGDRKAPKCIVVSVETGNKAEVLGAAALLMGN